MPVIQTPAECRIQIDGKEIKYDISSVQLDQFVDDHHVLRIRIRQLGKATSDKDFDDPGKYTGFLGKSIAMNITPYGGIVDSSRLLEFIGVVTEVSLDNSIDGLNTVLLTAHSPTVLLDGFVQNSFHYEMKASDIIKEIVGKYPITVGSIDATEATLKHSIQYRETDYQFIMRLASTNGMFAHYNGKEFGVSASTAGVTEVLYWRESLGVFALGLGTGIEKVGSQVYDYVKKDYYVGWTDPHLRSSLSDLPKLSFEASQSLYVTESFIPAVNAASQAELDKALELFRENLVGRIATGHGESCIPAVSVGKAIMIKGMDKLDGLYWVKSVRHVFDESGKYHNTFACTPLDMAFPQHRISKAPFTDLQTAFVLDVDDPEKLGRVKVQWPWNVGDAHLPGLDVWVRVLTPHAGEKRGWFCIPEVGDEVLVGFEHGDPHRPVVLGSLYNGKDIPPSDGHPISWSADNNLKLFRTKSGNEIYFCDDSGSETIVIVQKDKQNTITLSLDGPKIAIESEGDISLKAANISLESTSGDITLKSAAGLKTESTQDTGIKAGGNLTTEGSINYDMKAGVNATVKGSGVVTVQGSLVKIN